MAYVWNVLKLVSEKAEKRVCPRCKGFGANYGDADGCPLCGGYGELWMSVITEGPVRKMYARESGLY